MKQLLFILKLIKTKRGWEKTQSLNKENPQLFHFEGVGDFYRFKRHSEPNTL